MDPVHPPSPAAEPAADVEPAAAVEHDPDVAAALVAEQVANDYHPGLAGER